MHIRKSVPIFMLGTVMLLGFALLVAKFLMATFVLVLVGIFTLLIFSMTQTQLPIMSTKEFSKSDILAYVQDNKRNNSSTSIQAFENNMAFKPKQRHHYVKNPNGKGTIKKSYVRPEPDFSLGYALYIVR